MKYILGLDIGTNSLGWYLLRLNNAEYEIVNRGVTIFPIGTIVDPVKGLEKTKHASGFSHDLSQSLQKEIAQVEVR